ncbi:tRNA 2-thiouridine(34) synthase MnmA, partial [Candidatus Wolfebacteria bacterium]
GIPFKTLDLEKEYKQGVIDYMLEEYTAGRTPNPDVMCNKVVKFGAFLDWALSEGADYIATGHYAENIDNTLVKGFDDNKDQSYFLWTLTSEQLKHILFPIGHMEKPEVRKLAKKYDLITADKKDSQGLCFIGDIEMRDFLKHFIDTEKGDVLNKDGKVIGEHEGALLYTIGQRHGFTITQKTPTETPYFVQSKNVENNTIVVTHLGVRLPNSNRLVLENVNWISGNSPKSKIEARIRYRGKLFIGEIIEEKGAYVLVSDDIPNSVASGQSVVLYDGNTCLGGGVIQ